MTLAVAAMSVVFPWEPGHRLMSHSACGGAEAGVPYVLDGQPRAAHASRRLGPASESENVFRSFRM